MIDIVLVIEFHKDLINEFGGIQGLRDYKVLESALYSNGIKLDILFIEKLEF